MCSCRLSFIIFIFFQISLLFAEEVSNPRWIVDSVNLAEKKEISFFKEEGQWSWQRVGDGAFQLKARGVFKLPDILISSTVMAISPGAEVKFKGEKMLLLTNEPVVRIKFQRSQEKIYELEFRLVSTAFGIIQKDCQRLGLNLRILDAENIPFFFGAMCVLKSEGTKFILSLPTSAQIERSSVFDSQGKGESWRVYELGNIQAAKGEVAKLNINFNNHTYKFVLNSIKEEAQLKSGPEAKFSVSAGYASLNFKSEQAQASESKLFFMLRGLPYKIFWRLGLGIDLMTTLSLSQNENSISFLQILPYFYTRMIETKIWNLEGRGYFSITTENHASSGGGYQINQFGAGLASEFKVSQNWKLGLELRTDAISSKVIKSHSFADFRFLKLLTKDHLSWGGGLQYQSIKINETETSLSDFSHSLAYFTVVF